VSFLKILIMTCNFIMNNTQKNFEELKNSKDKIRDVLITQAKENMLYN
jgi:hypothetical protein